jgi:hypothetical protein
LFAVDHVPAEGGTEAGIDATVGDASIDATEEAGDAAPDALGTDGAAVVVPPAPKLLHSFDDGVVPPSNVSVNDGLNSGLINTLTGPAFTDTEGNTCPGALKSTIQFPANAEQADGSFVDEELNLSFPVSTDWTGYTKLHVHAKIEVTGGNYTQLNALQVFVTAGPSGSNNYINQGTFTSSSTFSDGGWHEITLPLVSNAASGYGGYDPAFVTGYGVQLLEASPPPAGAPTTAPVTTILLDDIWLE